MKLYYDPTTVNCRKVVAGLDLIGASYDKERIDYLAGDHKKPAFKKINPNAELPALIDDDLVLWESNAILVYVSEKLDNATAYPVSPQIRADITRWLLWEVGKWSPACYAYLVENVIKPILDDKPDEDLLVAHAPIFHESASILNAQLQGRDWLCDDHATIADIAVAAPMHLHVVQKLPLAEYANIRAWIARVEELPCWQNSDPIPHLAPEVLAKLA